MFLRSFFILLVFLTSASVYAFSTTGFTDPYGMAIDPATHAIYISNMVGAPDAQDANAFISKLKPDGTVDQLRFIDATQAGVVLSAPQGMVIQDGKLYVTDVDHIRVFDVATGKPQNDVFLGDLKPQHLSDMTIGTDGALYVVDGPANAVYQIDLQLKSAKALITDNELGEARAIVWDPTRQLFLVAGWASGKVVAYDGAGKRQSIPAVLIPKVTDLIADEAGNIYAASESLKGVYRLGVNFAVSGIALGIPAPAGIAIDNSNVVVVSTEANSVHSYSLPR